MDTKWSELSMRSMLEVAVHRNLEVQNDMKL